MKKLSWLLCLLASADIAVAALPVGNLDQDFSTLPSSFGAALSSTGDTLFAQSFTVGIGGFLSSVDLLIFDATSWSGSGAIQLTDVSVELRTVEAGLPSDTVLANSVVPASDLTDDPNGALLHVELASDIPVTPGQVLAVGIAGAQVGWSGHAFFEGQPEPEVRYLGGGAFRRPHVGDSWEPIDDFGGEYDFLFRTYVIPEPTTLSLLGLGSLALMVARRRR